MFNKIDLIQSDSGTIIHTDGTGDDRRGEAGDRDHTGGRLEHWSNANTTWKEHWWVGTKLGTEGTTSQTGLSTAQEKAA